MPPRRAKKPAKTGGALAGFIRQELAPLAALARTLNGEHDAPGIPAPALEAARAIVEGTRKGRPDEHAARSAFNELANQNPFVWRVGASFVVGASPQLDDPTTWSTHVPLWALRERGWKYAGGSALRLATPNELGYLVALLAAYLNNRHRARLRRCDQCQRWFVDMTRNRSSLRCSRPCTITWSNTHRKERSR